LFCGETSAAHTGGLQSVTQCLAELIIEPIFMHWPITIIGKSLARFPRRNTSKFSHLVRKTGHMFLHSKCWLHLHVEELRVDARRSAIRVISDMVLFAHRKLQWLK